MASTEQTVSWFLNGIMGKIPVWNNAGKEVGYRKSYNDMSIVLNPGYTNLPPLTTLYTKDFWGKDIAFRTAAAPTAATATPNYVTAPVIQPVTTAAQIAVDIEKQPALPVPLVMIAGGAVIGLLLLSKR